MLLGWFIPHEKLPKAMQSDCKKNRSRSSKTNGTITIELKVKYLEYEK